MGKIKLVVAWLLVSSLVSLGLFVRPVKAVSPVVSITGLPAYINNNTFKLSYTAISNDPSSITAQFYVKKEGTSYISFGPVITGASGQVQVTSTQVNDQVSYCFKVEINSGVAADETCSTYDVSGPSPAQNYWKEKVSPGSYRLHWKNPGDSDFSRVFIYRGNEAGFTADNSHKIGEVGGAPDAEASWDNFGLDSAAEYYYALRAVDNAGNSASLVGDTPTVIQETVASVTTQPNEAKVKVIPTETPKEEVLPAASENSPTPTLVAEPLQNTLSEAKEASKSSNRGILIAIITSLTLASGAAYLYLKNR